MTDVYEQILVHLSFHMINFKLVSKQSMPPFGVWAAVIGGDSLFLSLMS